MCGALLTGVWWIFPLIGFGLCLVFMVLAFRSGRGGQGCMCMGAPRAMVDDHRRQAGPVVNSESSH